MKQITIPKFFHELFGKKQNPLELALVILFTLLATLTVAWQDTTYWQSYSLLQHVILWLLYLDITGGVIANLTHGTNSHYNHHPKERWLFIAIHIQPLLLALVLSSSMTTATLLWLYTIVSASIVNATRHLSTHRTLAGFLMAFGLVGLLTTSPALPTHITILYMLYIIKVIYCFAVDHQLTTRKQEASNDPAE